jgi:hypothetical protein
MIEESADRYKRLLREEAARWAEALTNGVPMTLEAYREDVGHLKALRWALDLAEKTLDA